MTRPATRIRIGVRAALRRRYGYAALRWFRRAVATAAGAHLASSIGARPYDGEAEWQAIRDAYHAGVLRLRRRWPALDLDDPRARP